MPNTRACDCCSRRKVRCDRQQPCQNCQKSELLCSYNQPPKKRGPKGPTKIIQELRLKQAQERMLGAAKFHTSSENRSFSPSDGPQFYTPDGFTRMDCDEDSVSPTSIPSPVPCSPCGGFTYERRGAQYFPDPITGALAHPNPIFKPHRVLTRDFADSCSVIFFQNLYPIMPIFDRSRFRSQYLAEFHTSPQLYAVVASMCALTMIQLCAVSEDAGESWEPPKTLGLKIPREDMEKLCKTLMDETLRSRRFFEYIAKPDLDTVITSFFLFCCYGNLEKHDHAWYYLRESISFAQCMGLDDEGTYWKASMKARTATGRDVNRTLRECKRWRKMFWLLFITERAYAIQRHHPLTLRTTIDLPEIPKRALRGASRSPSSSPERDEPFSGSPAASPTSSDSADQDAELSVEDEAVLSNFVTLATLFQNMDDKFVSLWNQFSDISELVEPSGDIDPSVDEVPQILMDKLTFSSSWVEELHRQLETIGARAMAANKEYEEEAQESEDNLGIQMPYHFNQFDAPARVDESQPFCASPYTSAPSKPASTSSTSSTSSFIPIQKADILVSRQWLHLIIWRLSVFKIGRLRMKNRNKARPRTNSVACRDDPEDDVHGLTFPVKVAKDVLEITAKLSVEALEAHGIGMQEKLFDIGCSLARVIRGVRGNGSQVRAAVPKTSFEVTRTQYLHEIVKVLSELRGGKSRFFQDILREVNGVLHLNSPLDNGRGLIASFAGQYQLEWTTDTTTDSRIITELDSNGDQNGESTEVTQISRSANASSQCYGHSHLQGGEEVPVMSITRENDQMDYATSNYNHVNVPFGSYTFEGTMSSGHNLSFLPSVQAQPMDLYSSSYHGAQVQQPYDVFSPQLTPVGSLQTPQPIGSPSDPTFQNHGFECANNPPRSTGYYATDSAASSTIPTTRNSNVSTRRNSLSNAPAVPASATAPELVFSDMPSSQYLQANAYLYETELRLINYAGDDWRSYAGM
ncbi:hypothetical protein BDZ91DRAFT_750205 [Kalaharituber pfeilii]|nr:hypothetical protein BDZ91DRAFT_750205 [Kalaharituber pfeilii]